MAITPKKNARPAHPGAVLADLLDDMQLSANALALSLRVPPSRLSAILKRERSITPDTALRLARYFGNTAGFWMNLQVLHDLAVAEQELAGRIEREVIPASAA